jgi:hypothetical protein
MTALLKKQLPLDLKKYSAGKPTFEEFEGTIARQYIFYRRYHSSNASIRSGGGYEAKTTKPNRSFGGGSPQVYERH